MIKYCCDMCKEEIKGEVIKVELPLPQYKFARGGKDDVKLFCLSGGIGMEKVEICHKCYTIIGCQLEYMGIKSKTWNE